MRFVVPCAAVVALTACVSSGKYEQKQLEADQCAKALQDEREAGKKLASDLETVKGEREAARAETEKTRGDLDALRRDLEKAVAGKSGAEKILAEERAKMEQEKAAQIARQQQEFEDARKQLQDQIAKGDVELKRYKDRVIFGLAERVLFPSGSATLNKGGQATLSKVATTITEMIGKAEAEGRHRLVRVEGHTDNIPIATERFPSNWELSAARAAAVVRFLEGAGVTRDKLYAAGFGELWPVASNSNAEGRARNRRIEVALVPDSEKPAIQAEPSAANN